MFCPKCGKDLPDDSKFCLGCGNSLSAVTQPVATPKRSSGAGLWVLLVVLALVIWWFVDNASREAAQNRKNASLISQMVSTPRTRLITDSAVTVRAMGYTYYKVVVPPDAKNVFVDGRFSATGGSGNDIEVFVLNGDEFVNFQNGHPTPTYYNSGQVTQNSVSAALPGGGTYYLVLNNNFSLITPKAVEVSATLHYTY